MHVTIRKNVSLAPYTTFRIGGKARFFAEAKSVRDFLQLFKWAQQRQIPVFMLGLGSNVVFRDTGFAGLVLRYTAQKYKFKQNQVWTEGALPLGKLILEAEKQGLGGVENLFGIPGTIGGALYNNAGAHGISIGDFVQEASVFELQKEGNKQITRQVSADFFEFGYRHSILQNKLIFVLAATFVLKTQDPAITLRNRQKVLLWRRAKQPNGFSAGSFFKNPATEQTAGWLLDQVGAKGMRVGKIKVSEKHANFLINTGGGTCVELETLAQKLEKRVFDKFGVHLKKEVEIVG